MPKFSVLIIKLHTSYTLAVSIGTKIVITVDGKTHEELIIMLIKIYHEIEDYISNYGKLFPYVCQNDWNLGILYTESIIVTKSLKRYLKRKKLI